MKRTWIILAGFLLLVVSIAAPQTAQAVTGVAVQQGTNSACAAVGVAAAPIVNREGITELGADIVIAAGAIGDFGASDSFTVSFTSGVDLTSPVVASGATLPIPGSVVVCDGAAPTLAITSPVVNRLVGAGGTTVSFTFTVSTANADATSRVVFRNLRWDVSSLGNGVAFEIISATENAIAIAGAAGTDVAVASNTGAGTITTVGAGTQGAGGPLATQAVAAIAESFIGALRGARAANTTTQDIATTAGQVTFNVTGIPSGVTVTFPSTFTASTEATPVTNRFQLASATTPLTATGGALAVTYNTTRESLTAAQTALDFRTAGAAATNRIVVTIGTSSGFGTASIQVSFGPDSASTAIPRYAGGANSVSGTTVGRGLIPTGNFFSIAAVQTSLIFPWTFNTFSFESAYALSNTGKDDLGTAGASQATGQSGVIRCTVFANDGTTTSITTSASVRPGRGLNADGTLSPGGTWAVTLTDILGAATPPVTAKKEGYLICQTSFDFAHAAGFSIDPAGGFFSTPVVIPPSVTARTSPEVQH